MAAGAEIQQIRSFASVIPGIVRIVDDIRCPDSKTAAAVSVVISCPLKRFFQCFGEVPVKRNNLSSAVIHVDLLRYLLALQLAGIVVGLPPVKIRVVSRGLIGSHVVSAAEAPREAAPSPAASHRPKISFFIRSSSPSLLPFRMYFRTDILLYGRPHLHIHPAKRAHAHPQAVTVQAYIKPS